MENGYKNNNHLNGEKSPNAKLNEELVRKIKQNYIFRKFSVAKVAKNLILVKVVSIILFLEIVGNT